MTEPTHNAEDVAHVPTVIQEGGGRFSVICSCGWRSGGPHDSEISARMAWSMDHRERGGS